MREGTPAIHRYVLRPQKDAAGWAVILLTGDGQFCAFSDRGNYAFWWTSHGSRDFRAFFLDAEEDYLTNKFTSGVRDHFDAEKTTRLVREAILDRRRRGMMTREEAAAEWERASGLVGADAADFRDWLHDTKLQDAYEYGVYRPDPQAQSFVRDILLGRLVPLLRVELEALGIVAPTEARA